LQSASLTVTDQWPAGPYLLAMVAVGDDSPASIPSNASATQTWVRFSAPTELTYQANSTHTDALLSWKKAAPQADYVIEVLSPQGTVVYSLSVTGTNAETQSASIPFADLPAKATLSARVRTVPVTTAEQETIPSLWSESVSIDTALTAQQIAAQCFAQGDSATVCAQQIIQAFPALPLAEMALSMAQAGYPADQTAVGLVAVYTTVQADALAGALAKAYHIIPVAAAIAQTARENGESGPDCAQHLRATYPQISLTESAIAMATGGYLPESTARAALSQQSNLSATALSDLLITAYRRSETS
jgi:hypothetical protein